MLAHQKPRISRFFRQRDGDDLTDTKEVVIDHPTRVGLDRLTR